MSMNEAFLGELGYEAMSTRKILERVPTEKFDWKPHEKSMTMGQLANHVADMFAWYALTLDTDELDFASGSYKPPKPDNTGDLVALFDKNLAMANESIGKSNAENFGQMWTLRSGEHVIFSLPKTAALRTFVINHIVHHRGQLSLYLRMNDIPVPSIYGPSADEQ